MTIPLHTNLVALMLLSCLAIGCDQNSEEKPTPVDLQLQRDLREGNPFVLFVEDFGFGRCDNSLQLNSKGELTLLFSSHPYPAVREAMEKSDKKRRRTPPPASFKRVQFPLTKKQIDEIRFFVAMPGFLSLSESYHEGVMDGHQQYITLRCEGREKKIYCDNRFPSLAKDLVGRLDTILRGNDWAKYPIAEFTTNMMYYSRNREYILKTGEYPAPEPPKKVPQVTPF